MMTPQTVLGYVKAEPFRALRIHLASGRTFDKGLLGCGEAALERKVHMVRGD